MEEKITLEQAAEYLRLALPLMARHRVSVTPDNYAVWYAYVAGANQDLRLAVDEILGQGGGFDEHVMALLYQRFLCPWDEARAVAAQEALSKVVERSPGIGQRRRWGRVALPVGTRGLFTADQRRYRGRGIARSDRETRRGDLRDALERRGFARESCR